MKADFVNVIRPNEEAYRELEIANFGDGTLPQQEIYISLPRKNGNCPGIIWFHGGGLTGEGREVPDFFFRKEFVVFEPRYRLSPGCPAPAALEDAVAAVAWIWSRREEYGLDRLFLGGMSAGAYLAAMVGMDRKYLEEFGFDCRELTGLLLISGQMTTHFQFKADLRYPQSQFEPVIDRYAPLAHLAADLPPILLVTGEAGRDMPARPEENAFMAASLRALGHPLVRFHSIPGADHGGAFEGCESYIADFLGELA